MNKRERIFNKYGGLCAYSGTPLKDDWQIDHIEPIFRTYGVARFPNEDDSNLVPCQRIINHYKGSLHLRDFREWLLGELHLRLAKLPKKTRIEKTAKRKEYLLEVASYFGIDEKTPFNQVFYFELTETT